MRAVIAVREVIILIILICLIIFICLTRHPAHAQLIDPNRHCYYPTPSSHDCVPIPPQQQQQFVPPIQQPISNDYALCWSTAPVPGTKNMIISNVFATLQTTQYLVNELEQYESSQGINVNFDCEIGPQQTESMRATQMISSMAMRGFNISQVTAKPH